MHANYKGNKLVHHHVEQGRFAVPLPESVHRKFTSQLHKINGSKFNSNVRMVKGTSFLSSMTALFSMVSIFTDSPNSPIYMFFSPGEGKQNRAYVDFMTGQIYEWSLRDNNIREVRFYKDYKRVGGTWRGVDMTNKQYFDKSGKPLLIN